MAPFGFGHLAVAAFIVLSGYCLQMSLFTSGDGHIRSLPRFFGRRARRILPAYYACLALSIAVSVWVTPRMAGMPFEQYLPVTTENVFAHVLMVHNLSPDWMYKLNGVLWSIAIEAQLYLLFPLLVSACFRVGRRWALISTAVTSALVLQWVPGSIKLYPWYLALFTLGIVAAHYAYRPHLRGGSVEGVARSFSVLAFLTTLWLCVQKESIVVADVSMGLAIASFCYASTVAPRGLLYRLLSTRVLAGLGSFSYSLYLLHHPLQQTVFLFRPAWVQDQSQALIYLLLVAAPVCLGGSWLFSLVFERPFLKKPALPVQPVQKAFVPTSLPILVAGPPSRAVVSLPTKNPQAETFRSA